jgi:drug/metabolite transporter (DMT)-like permease
MQRFTSAARAAVIFTMEPLSAAIFAYAYAGEVLRPLQLAGGIIIVASMLLTELGTLHLRPKK